MADTTDTSTTADSLRPIAAAERVETLDILRGFALFGVLLVNMEGFVSPSYPALYAAGAAWPLADRVAYWAVRFFGEHEFHTLFAFLFGYGLALQMGRADERHARFGRFAARRLAILFIIGLLHAVLFWPGDILHTFAVFAFVLLLFFRTRRDRTLLVWICLLFIVPALLMSGVCFLVSKAEARPELAAKLDRYEQENRLEMERNAEQKMDIYRHGSLGQILARRWLDLREFWGMLPLTGPIVMGNLLIGFVVGRRQWLHDTRSRAPTLRRLLLIAIPVGAAAKVTYLFAISELSYVRVSWWWALAAATAPWAALALATSYTSVITLGTLRPIGHRLLAPLAAVGRTTLTNYLAQSVICTTLMCGYGFGLYGRVHPPAAIGLTFAIFLVQVWVSNTWLRRFRFGPAEWLWRVASYGRLLPMRR